MCVSFSFFFVCVSVFENVCINDSVSRRVNGSVLIFLQATV